VHRLRIAHFACVAGLTAAAGFPCFAQQADRIAGQVTDGRSNPIDGVRITIVGSPAGAITDRQGRFHINGLTGPTVTIRVQRLGYAEAVRPASVGDSTLSIVLTDVAVSLNQIVVTGTAGGAQRRAVGNAVAEVQVADLVPTEPVLGIDQILTGRAPGVSIESPGGLPGGGSQVMIRGRSSFSLTTDPIVYVDGVRVNAQSPTGGSGTSAVSRLNDFAPEDIQSIEIIKGPAASTLYGTEASNGVIQIITKKGAAGTPQFGISVRQGTLAFMNPEGRWLTNWYTDPSTNQVIPFNLAQNETGRGTPLFHDGYIQGYSANVSGGTPALRYFSSATYDRTDGVEPNSVANTFDGRANLAASPSKQVDLSVNLSANANRNNMGDAGELMFESLLSNPATRNTPSRGFFASPSEVIARNYFSNENLDRATGGIAVSHHPLSWLTERLQTGFDLSDVSDQNLVTRFSAADAVFVAPSTAAGNSTVNDLRQLNTTVDYNATATAPAWHGVTPQSSVGFQYYRLSQDIDTLRGIGFPTHLATSIGDAAVTSGSTNLITNETVGGYGQEQFSYNDRLFLTAAVRIDDNSAFGSTFKYATYPKVSGSWVASDEPFWHISVLNPFRLRFAYGQSGLQPQAFTALQTYEAITGQNGQSAVSPQLIGNPNLGPERSQEIEGGFEAGFFHQRISLDFTGYYKTTNHAIVLRNVAPSTGFGGGQQYVNLGEIRNDGIEVSLNAHIYDSPSFRWDATINEASNANDVVSIGLPNTPYLQFGFGNRFEPGFPAYAFFSRVVVSADRGPNGTIINIMCDGGRPSGNGLPNSRRGGAPVPCATAPDLYVGNTDPTYFGSAGTHFTYKKRLTLSILADFKGGNKIWDSAEWCPGIVGCYAKVYPGNVSPVEAAHYVLGYTDDAAWIKDIEFVKLREISLSYVLPPNLAGHAFGGKQTTLAVAARNIHTWTPYNDLDPENVSLYPNSNVFGTIFNQNELPQLFQFVVKLNVTY